VLDLKRHPDVRTHIEESGVKVVGAYYSFCGAVTFFDDNAEVSWRERRN
jgi:hypothetical protein